MIFTKNVVSSFSSIKPKSETGVGEMRLHIGAPSDQQLVDMELVEDGNVVRFKFNSRSISTLSSLFFSFKYYNLLKTSFNLRVSNTLVSINEENFISIGEFYNLLLGLQDYQDIRIKNDGGRVFLVSTEFFKPICHICFPNKSQIVIEKLDINTFDLKLKFDDDFLSEFGIFQKSTDKLKTDGTLVSDFHFNLFESGLLFPKNLVYRFICSLITKPFLLLTGLSGSGKTKLAQAFAIWISESQDQYLLVPVGADWTNREPLLGYPNSLEPNKYITPESGALEIIKNAIENPNKPYFLILDEMNLSHVERYFADFLSAMESKEYIRLYSDTDRYTEFDLDNKPVLNSKVISHFTLPTNLFIIGTVNIDETTYMFSPKVLDRANTIEFRINEDDLKYYFSKDMPLNLRKLYLDEDDSMSGAGFIHSNAFMESANIDNQNVNYDDISKILTHFFVNLKSAGAEFGYRTTNEIARLIYNLESLGSQKNESIDFAIMQKLLPKLHGSRSKMARILPVLANLCLKNIDSQQVFQDYTNEVDVFEKYKNEILYKVSLEKIFRMHKNALDNGFTSYAEA